MGKVTEQERAEYQKCLEYLRSTGVPLAELREQLHALEKFYEREEQTPLSRQGILWTLPFIQTYEQYRKFLDMHKELLKVWIEFVEDYEQDWSGAGPYSFFSIVTPDPLRTGYLLEAAYSVYGMFGPYTHAVLQSMITVGKFVAANFEADEEIKPFILFVIRRIGHFLQGYTQVKEILVRSGIQKKSDRLVPTDGDMHCGGRVPYQVVWKQKQWIYKPHNMRAEGVTTAALQFFSDILGGMPDKLKVLDIFLLEDDTGLMEFAPHADTLDETCASQYFFKLGALLYFSRLFGIGDLHHDNIMATTAGPVLIDLECVLDFSTIRSKTIADMSLKKLKKAFNSRKLENATFKVGTKIPFFKDYGAQILDGFTKASNCCIAYEDNSGLVSYYRDLLCLNLLSGPFFHRVVPYATADFYDYMYNIINNYSSPDIIENELDRLCKEEILPPLINICCQGTGIDEKTFRNNYLNMKMFSTRIYWDLFCGDIPIFHLRYECDSENKVYQVGYLDDQPFFTRKMCIGTIDSLVQDFEAKMRWLATKEASDALREFIES